MINTGMFEGVSQLFIPTLDAKFVANQIINSILREDPMLVLPSYLYFLPLSRLLPINLVDFVANFVGATNSMKSFQGRGNSQQLLNQMNQVKKLM